MSFLGTQARPRRPKFSCKPEAGGGCGEGVGEVPVEDGREPVWFISDVQCPGQATRQTLDTQPTI